MTNAVENLHANVEGVALGRGREVCLSSFRTGPRKNGISRAVHAAQFGSRLELFE